MWVIIFIHCSSIIFAQKGRVTNGKVTDSLQNGLPGVTVKLFARGSKDTLQTLTDKKGVFSFSQIRYTRFTIRATFSEYSPFENEFKFPDSAGNIYFLEIMLRHSIKELEEVVMETPFIRFKEDTIEYKADSIQIKPDATVEDILRKLPGIEVSKNGFITAQGKPVYKIKVNGKDFFRSDVKIATRELPASVVDRIQVIDDYGEEAGHTGIKTGEAVKVINLKLKKDKSNGLFGNVMAGIGTSQSYQAKASMNFFDDRSQISIYGNSNNINNGFVITNTGNTTIAMLGAVAAGSTTGVNNIGSSSGNNQQNNNNIPDGITTSHTTGANFRFDFGKWNSLYGSYSYGKRKTKGFRELYQQQFYPFGNIINEQRYNYNNAANSHNLSLNFELYPDSLSYLKISPDISYSKSNNNSKNEFDYTRDIVNKISMGNWRDTSNSSNTNIGINIHYNQGFKKKGRNVNLSFYIGPLRSKLESNRKGFTRIWYSPLNFDDSIQIQQIQESSSGDNYHLYIAYTEPVSKNKHLDLTYFHDYSKSESGRDVFIPLMGNSGYILDSTFSNQFTNRFINNRISMTFRSVQKKINYSLGLHILPVYLKTFSAENDTIDKKQKSINIAPSARLSMMFKKARQLTISYNGMNRQPGFLQMQPVRDISNPQFQREGNPGLKPEFRHNAGLSFNSFNPSSGRSFFSSLNVSAVRDKIIQNTVLLDSFGAKLSRPENINGNYQFSGFYSYTRPWQKNKFNLKLYGSYNYSNDVILVNSKKASGTNRMLVQGLQVNYDNRKWLEFVVEVNYSATATRNLLTQSNNFTISTWIIGNQASFSLPAQLIVKYNFEKQFNNGFVGNFNGDLNLLNVSVEKKLLKKKSLYLSFTGFNILDQSTSYAREVTDNTITDFRFLQLSRYFLFTLLYRWNKFGAKN
jgi:hypothetical protein